MVSMAFAIGRNGADIHLVCLFRILLLRPTSDYLARYLNYAPLPACDNSRGLWRPVIPPSCIPL